MELFWNLLLLIATIFFGSEGMHFKIYANRFNVNFMGMDMKLLFEINKQKFLFKVSWIFKTIQWIPKEFNFWKFKYPFYWLIKGVV